MKKRKFLFFSFCFWCLFVCLFIYLFVCLFVYLFVCLFVCDLFLYCMPLLSVHSGGLLARNETIMMSGIHGAFQSFSRMSYFSTETRVLGACLRS